jgi:manganese/iron transport system substrate-binding protein
VTNHDAFNYFCRDYGFRSQAPVGWSTGQEVGAGTTPERRREVVRQIQSRGVKAVFLETTINPKMIRELAKEAGVVVGGELYSDSMGPEDSAAKTYIGMMRENVLTMVEALTQ